MTVQTLVDKQIVRAVNAGDNMDREITQVFCCDLLSIAMGRAPAGCAWVTVMANLNTLAVASLADVACVILAEGFHMDENGVKKAQMQGITLLETDGPVFETALAVYQAMNEE
ncbi:MAG: hypothetical protein ACOX8K_11000 [Lachnospiraceae bacterium]|jgi:hypothetical protein